MEHNNLDYCSENYILLGAPQAWKNYADALISKVKDTCPDKFEGNADSFSFELRYTAPFDKGFYELKRLQGTAAKTAGRRSDFQGYIIVDLSSWLTHHNEAYLDISLLFLVDMSDRWKYIFLINDQNPAASKELACKVLKIFFQNHIYCKVKESEMRCSIKNRVSAICKEHRLECSQPVKDLLQELLKRNFSECIVSALLDEVSQNSNRTINMDIIFKAISNRDSAVFYMLTRKECERFINIVEQQKENRYVEKRQYEAAYAGYVYDKADTYWTSTDEMRHQLTKVDFTKSGNIKAGGMPIISDGKTVYIDDEDGHTAVIACSGMKKSICGFMPLIKTLAKAEENMILTDPKGELFSRMSGFLKSCGYKVLCLDFRTMDKDCFNVLHYAASVYRSGEKDKGLALLSDIINALAEDQRHHAKDPFWPETGALWLNGTGAVMLDAFPKIEQVNILNWSDFNVYSSASMVEDELLMTMPDNTAKAALKQCLSSAENTFKSILITASSFLTMFNQNPKLAAMLSHSTFSLEDLLNPKVALFLVTDDTTSTADPILGMIISQIQSFLVNEAYYKRSGRLAVRMNFVLDEFASIPIPNMDKALATHRSRNIRYYLCVQSLALLKERYENPEKLLSNCTSTLYLGSTELELLKELEVKLGKTCITPDGKEKPLCSQAELMKLKKAWDYKEAIYMNLSKGIRYCTMLPSIEAYDIGNYEVPTDRLSPYDEIDTYTVAEFVSDVMNKRIQPPFAAERNRRIISQGEQNKYIQSSTGDNPCNVFVEEELSRKFNELFEDD